MFERFTDQARQIVVLAQEEPGTFNHDHIGPEHILLALIRQDAGTAARALESLGITEAAARQQVEEITGRGRQPPRGHIPFTPQGKKALELSLREAIALGSNSIDSEHILLGLIRAGESPAIEVLNGLGVEPNRVRQRVIALIAESRGADASDPRALPVSYGGRKRRLKSEVRGRLESIEWRLSVLEHRVGTGPNVHDLDREIAQVRHDIEAAVDTGDVEDADALRSRERQLLSQRADRIQEWAVLGSLTDEIERLRDLLRRHGIDPQDNAA